MRILLAEMYRKEGELDQVKMHTDLPSPNNEDDHLILRFGISRGKGVQYMRDNFPDLNLAVTTES